MVKEISNPIMDAAMFRKASIFSTSNMPYPMGGEASFNNDADDDIEDEFTMSNGETGKG